MKPFRLLRRMVTWSTVGLAGGAVVVTVRHLLETPRPLESALPGEGRIDRRHEGDIYYNLAGPADAGALVLLHDFYPGASNFEFRRVFARLAQTHRVYAPDWLGFGMSERPALAYTGEFYAHLLREYLRGTVGQPAAVLAHGLAGNVAVRAASDEPSLFSRLVLVAPRTQAGTEEAPTVGQSLIRGAQRSSMGLVPYAALTTRPALRWQLQRRAARPGQGAATDDAVDHLYASSHQFGGQFAPLAELTGELDLPLQNALALLEPPVLIVAGERDTIQPLPQLEDLVLLNPHAQLLTIAGAGDAIYEDAPDAFVDRVNLWLSTPRKRHTPRPTDAMRAGSGAPLPPRDRPTPAVVATPAAAAAGASLRGGILSPEEDATGDGATSAAPAATRPDGAPDGAQEPKPGEPRFDPTSPTSAMTGTRGDVRATPAPSDLPRDLEAPDEEWDEAPTEVPAEAPTVPTAHGAETAPPATAANEPAEQTSEARGNEETLAGDTLRASMSAPEAPVPTTIAAMTAPLDETAPRPEEGADHPLTGPHPVPADARAAEDTRANGQAPEDATATPTIPTAGGAADARIARNEQARVTREANTTKTRQTADVLAATEQQVGEEAARLDERIQAAGPATERGETERGETERGEEATTEAELPTPAAVTREPAKEVAKQLANQTPNDLSDETPDETPSETTDEAPNAPRRAPSAAGSRAGRTAGQATRTGSRSVSQSGGEPARAASSRAGRAAKDPERTASGETRQAPGRAGTPPASGKGANKGGAQGRSAGQSGSQAGGSKRRTSHKPKHR